MQGLPVQTSGRVVIRLNTMACVKYTTVSMSAHHISGTSSTAVGVFHRAERAEYSLRIHPTPESHDQRPGWKICVGTVSVRIDAEDQASHAGFPIQRELSRQVVRRPKSHDLQEPPLPWIGAVLKCEIRKDQRAIGGDQLWLPVEVAFPRGPPGVAAANVLSSTVL